MNALSDVISNKIKPLQANIKLVKEQNIRKETHKQAQ